MPIDKMGINKKLKDKEIKGNFTDCASPKNSAQEYAKICIDQFSFFYDGIFQLLLPWKNETDIHIL